MKKLLLASLLLSTLTGAGAAETWGSLTLTSYHVNPSQKFNQRNYGAGLEIHPDSTEYVGMFGAYRNSVERTSAYALAGWTPITFGIVKIGITGGLITGYPGLNNGHVAPAAGGLIRIEGKTVGANIMIIPPGIKEDKSPLTFGLQIKYKF